MLNIIKKPHPLQMIALATKISWSERVSNDKGNKSMNISFNNMSMSSTIDSIKHCEKS